MMSRNDATTMIYRTWLLFQARFLNLNENSGISETSNALNIRVRAASTHQLERKAAAPA